MGVVVFVIFISSQKNHHPELYMNPLIDADVLPSHLIAACNLHKNPMREFQHYAEINAHNTTRQADRDDEHSIPSWWIEPTQCKSMADECSQTGSSGASAKFEASLGQHICALDTCRSGASMQLWESGVKYHYSLMQSIWDRLPPRIAVIGIGDSTNSQQLRSLSCLLEEIYDERSYQEAHNLGCNVFTKQSNRNISRAICSHHANYFNRSILNSKDGDIAHFIDRVLHNRDADHFRDAHIVFVINLGTWTNCVGNSCGTWHEEVAALKTWWLDLEEALKAKASLVFRDPLPQHFNTPDSRYNRRERTGLCIPPHSCSASGQQATKLANMLQDETTPIYVNVPDKHLRRLPVWGLSVRLHYMHNIRHGDCSHYCIALTSLWNLMLAQIIGEETRADTGEAGAFIKEYLIKESTSASEVDLSTRAFTKSWYTNE